MRSKDGNLHFGDLKSFYIATREDNINNFCTDMFKYLHPKATRDPSSDGEWNSWFYSLPDLAELLFDPYTYRDKTVVEGLVLQDDLGKEIEALDLLISSTSLASFRGSEEYSALKTAPGTKSLNKALNYETISDMKALERTLSFLDQGRLEETRNALSAQKEDLSKAINALSTESLPTLPSDIEVDIEYPLVDQSEKKNPNRIDVLLSQPSKNRYAIIELKQWTEDSIYMSVTENDDGEKECIVGIFPGTHTQPHPAVKVRDVYKKALALEHPGSDIRCFVYLHNQMYHGGQLFKAYSLGVNTFDDCPAPNNILYTKLWHGRLLKRLADLFADDPS